MKRTKKIKLFWVNLLMVTILCGAVVAQLYGNASKLFAKAPLSITMVGKDEVTEQEEFLVDLSDERELKELGKTLESKPTDIVTFDSSVATTDSEKDQTVDVKREWKVVIPKGLTFDEEAEKAMLLKENKDVEPPRFNWNEDERTLTISVASDQTTLRLALTAEKSGNYQIEFNSADATTDATKLAVTVAEVAGSTKSEEEKPTAALVETRSLRLAGTAEVTDWESFVRALADTSITTISLQNDISLSGILQNYDGLFSTSSVDMTSEENVYLFINKAASSRSITIDGNNHTFNFGNLAIGLLNPSTVGSTQAYWIFDFVNIDVISRNFSGPIYKSSHTAASATTNGLTGTARTNTQINFSSGATHVRQITTMLGYLIALNDYNVPNIEIMTDLWTTAGTMVQSYFLYSPNTSVSTQVFSDTSATNNSGGMVHIYFTNMNGNARPVNVEGNGYTLDFGALVYHFMTNNNNGGKSWAISFNNMKVYHGNYWGAIIYNAGGTMLLNDYTGYGPQFMEAGTTNLVLSGKTHLEQVASYTSLAKNGSTIRTWAVNNERQSSLSVNSATITDNAEVYIGSRGSNVLEISGGNFDIGDNATVDFERGNAVTTSEGGNTNITIRDSGKFNVGKGSIVNMYNHHATNGTVINLQGSGAGFNIEEQAVVNVVTDAFSGNGDGNPGTGTGTSQNPIYIGGGSLTVAGTLNVKTENMGASTSNIIYAGAAAVFTVNSKGTLDIQSSSNSYAQNLIYMAGSAAATTFQFSDAERVNLQRMVPLSTGTNNTNSGLIRSTGNLDVSVQNVYQWSIGNYSGGSDGDSSYNFDYMPMSNMTLTYGGNAQPTITTANSMSNAVLANFRSNFTTQAQRVLFTRVPDVKLAIHSVANDNPDNDGSRTIYGYAAPGAYIRIWEEALNGTTSSKAKGVGDTIPSPVEDTTMPQETRNNFTVRADVNGDWTYTLEPDKYFTAGNVIHVYGFLNLKSEELTQVVLDKTPPTATPVTYFMVQGDALPNPSAFVKDVSDTSPINTGFNYAFTDPAEAETQRNTIGTHTIRINVSDQATDADGQMAPNTTIVEAVLVVYEEASELTANDFEAPYVDIRNLTNEQLSTYILTKSEATGFTLANGQQIDLTEFIEVTDFGGLNDYDNLQPNMPYVVTLTVPANADTGLTAPLTMTITVEVINMDAVLTVQFEDESGMVLSGYTLTIGEGQTIDTSLNVGDVIDLTSPSFHAIQDQLTALATAGYEISSRPENEAALPIIETEQTVTYQVTGQLFLQSAPTTVDFGSLTYNAKVQRVDSATPDADLIVKDTRANKTEGWTLYAALTADMTNSVTGSVMNEALWYVNSSGDEIPLTLDYGNQAVYTNVAGGTFDVTSTWGNTSEDPGLKLIADPTKTTVSSVGTYAGVVTWTIMAGQP